MIIRCTTFHDPLMPCGIPLYWIIFAGTPFFFSATYICSASEYGTRWSTSPWMNNVAAFAFPAYVSGDWRIMMFRASSSHG